MVVIGTCAHSSILHTNICLLGFLCRWAAVRTHSLSIEVLSMPALARSLLLSQLPLEMDQHPNIYDTESVKNGNNFQRPKAWYIIYVCVVVTNFGYQSISHASVKKSEEKQTK